MLATNTSLQYFHGWSPWVKLSAITLTCCHTDFTRGERTLCMSPAPNMRRKPQHCVPPQGMERNTIAACLLS